MTMLLGAAGYKLNFSRCACSETIQGLEAIGLDAQTIDRLYNRLIARKTIIKKTDEEEPFQITSTELQNIYRDLRVAFGKPYSK